jgi:hypothetical protein
MPRNVNLHTVDSTSNNESRSSTSFCALHRSIFNSSVSLAVPFCHAAVCFSSRVTLDLKHMFILQLYIHIACSHKTSITSSHYADQGPCFHRISLHSINPGRLHRQSSTYKCRHRTTPSIVLYSFLHSTRSDLCPVLYSFLHSTRSDLCPVLYSFLHSTHSDLGPVLYSFLHSTRSDLCPVLYSFLHSTRSDLCPVLYSFLHSTCSDLCPVLYSVSSFHFYTNYWQGQTQTPAFL